jgi:hypothetical protein
MGILVNKNTYILIYFNRLSQNAPLSFISFTSPIVGISLLKSYPINSICLRLLKQKVGCIAIVTSQVLNFILKPNYRRQRFVLS